MTTRAYNVSMFILRTNNHGHSCAKIAILWRGMINLVSRRESKNNFDSNDVLTGRVNLAPPKALFLHFFFGGAHTTQFNQGYSSQRGHLFNHFGTEKVMH